MQSDCFRRRSPAFFDLVLSQPVSDHELSGFRYRAAGVWRNPAAPIPRWPLSGRSAHAAEVSDERELHQHEGTGGSPGPSCERGTREGGGALPPPPAHAQPGAALPGQLGRPFRRRSALARTRGPASLPCSGGAFPAAPPPTGANRRLCEPLGRTAKAPRLRRRLRRLRLPWRLM